MGARRGGPGALGRIGDPTALTHLESILDDEGYEALSEDMQLSVARMRRLYLATRAVADFEAEAAEPPSET